MEDVKVINNTTQEFMGERFYLCGNYFQHRGKRLHRAVWEAHNGPIPKDCHVHHIDEDRANNSIGNLMLMRGKDHLLLHANEESRIENGKRAIKFAQEAAKEWHRSEAGKEWHSEATKKLWKTINPKTYVCECCGKEYESRTMGKSKFCSNKCRSAYRRHSGVDDEQRICQKCGKAFTCNKYSKQRYCSMECAR